MKKDTKMAHKQSSVIKPGTGSGSRPMGGSTKTPVSAPEDKKTMGRVGNAKVLK